MLKKITCGFLLTPGEAHRRTIPSLSLLLPLDRRPNACLQLRRAISIQAERSRLLEKYAIAPSAARLCWPASWRRTLFFHNIFKPKVNRLKHDLFPRRLSDHLTDVGDDKLGAIIVRLRHIKPIHP